MHSVLRQSIDDLILWVHNLDDKSVNIFIYVIKTFTKIAFGLPTSLARAHIIHNSLVTGYRQNKII